VTSLPNQRLVIVDSLRGFALMGLFIVHMVEYFELYWYAPEPGWVHDVVFSLFGGKAYAMFALLFGLSFYIIMDNQAKRGADFRGRFAWRLTLLCAMGYLHGVLYSGDILQVLGVAGFTLLLAWSVPTRWLWMLAALLLLQAPVIGMLLWHAAAGTVPAEALHRSVMPVTFEIYALGSFSEVAQRNLYWGQLGKWLFMVESGRLWTILGMFMAGLALGRSAFFAAAHRHRKATVYALTAGLLTALFCHLAAGSLQGSAAWSAVLRAWMNTGLMAAGVALFVLVYDLPLVHGALKSLAAPGRMSLTIYASQSLYGVPLFYGFGLGAYARIGQVNALLLGVTLWLLQIALAHWWLKRFHYGPLEWLWRAATYTRTDIRFRRTGTR
jgi:uncharacterized protein